MLANFIRDKGGTRSGLDRRKKQLIYMQQNRRSGQDRRSGNDRRIGADRYIFIERRDVFKES